MARYDYDTLIQSRFSKELGRGVTSNLSFSVEQFPNCCGIMLLHEFCWNGFTDDYPQESIDVVTREDGEKFAEIIKSEGNDAQFGLAIVVVGDHQHALKDLIRKPFGWKRMRLFNNPNSGNDVRVFGLEVTPGAVR